MHFEVQREQPISLHQSEIKRNLKRWYGSTRIGTLEFRQSELKHDLKVGTEKMRGRKIFQERRKINFTFNVNPKAIYHGFRKTSEFEMKEGPRKKKSKAFGAVSGIKRNSITSQQTGF